MTRWQKLQRLSWAERWLLGQALLLLPLTSLALGLIGVRRCHAAMAWLSAMPPIPPNEPREEVLARVALTARLVQAAARNAFPGVTCLPRSLVLWWLLRRQGIAGEVWIGVRKVADRLEAHAWVEFAGNAFDATRRSQPRFTAFDRAIPLGTGSAS